ncbi:amino acid permease-associated region [Caldivirga maquilingensis IC-167]|uniref:Amino acid permease-associated region n=2 Tax=Caldivirga maquilingensis TaxID=76887 RepID=A8MCZ6_CALMQ|nr:amino acid permease-associated region [Caldivirga maquilingensis IC-167]
MVPVNMALFVRQSSGLVKRASLWDAAMLNVANMGAGLAVFIGISPFVIPGAVLWLSSILTFILTLPLVILYTYFIARIPRTGGDYVWITRKLHGGLGSIMGIALAFNMPPFFALSAFFSVTTVNNVLLVIGYSHGQQDLIKLANIVFSTSNAWFNYTIALIAFIIILLINIIRPSAGFKLTTALGALALTGTAAAMIVLGFSIPTFHQSIGQFLRYFNLTNQSAYTGPSFSLPATLYMIPYFASYAYIWLYAGPAVAAEIRDRRGLLYNEILGSVITVIFITLPFLLMDLAAGYSFNMTYYPTSIYNFWNIAIYLARNEALQWFIGLGLIAWEFFIMAFGVIVFARYVFAFSFDRLFPEIFSRLNKWGSPMYAHLLDLAATAVFLAFPIISPNGYEALYSYTPLAIIYLILVSVAGIKAAREEGNKGMLVSSVLSLIPLSLLGYEAFTNPYFGVIESLKPLQPYYPGLAYVLGLIGLGAVVYTASKYINMKRGIDITLVYKEIPPE